MLGTRHPARGAPERARATRASQEAYSTSRSVDEGKGLDIMADEIINGAAPAAALPISYSYVALHALSHDGVIYEKGDIFTTSDKALGDKLREDKALALQHELQSADETAARIAELEAQLAAAQAKLVAAQEDEQAIESAAAAAKASASKK